MKAAKQQLGVQGQRLQFLGVRVGRTFRVFCYRGHVFPAPFSIPCSFGCEAPLLPYTLNPQPEIMQ